MARKKEPKPNTIGAGAALLKERLAELTEKLSAIGITTKVNENRSNSNGQLGLELSLDWPRKRLEFSIEGSDFDASEYDLKHLPKIEVLHTSKKHRQAVLLLQEVARTLTREVILTTYSENNATKEEWERRFPVNLPDGTTYTHGAITKKAVGPPEDTRWEQRAKVTAKVKASRLCFLVGYDEKHLFISLLPKKVSTVAAAHAALVPKAIKGKRGVMRQGEFFFVPATEAETKRFFRGANAMDSNHSDDSALVKNHESSDHIAQCSCTLNEVEQYVTGYIRHDRHATIFLNGWYRVVPNMEIPNPSDSTTWD